jgi:hypothetical protein
MEFMGKEREVSAYFFQGDWGAYGNGPLSSTLLNRVIDFLENGFDYCK